MSVNTDIHGVMDGELFMDENVELQSFELR